MQHQLHAASAAIANECGIRLNVEIANEISEKTPNLCHLAPAGPTYMEDLNEAGGVYAVMNEINKLGLLHTELMTCTGKTVAENIQGCVNLNPEVIRPVENPYSKTGGIAVLKGNLAPDSCVVKRSAVAPEMLRHEGPARVFDCEEDAMEAITSGKIQEGDVVVIRYEGPKAPVCRRCSTPPRPSAATRSLAVPSPDHRRKILRSIQRTGHRTCIAGGGSRRSHCIRGRRRSDRTGCGEQKDRHRGYPGRAKDSGGNRRGPGRTESRLEGL